MGFIDIGKEILNITETENGDKAFKSTGNECLDFFYLVGGKRYDVGEALKLFFKAYLADQVTALKLLLFTRDIKGGLGERNLFRNIFYNLAKYDPKNARIILVYVIKYGRYDDLFCVIGTPLEEEMISMIDNQLKQDIENKKAGKPISLLAKWLPSINTSNAEARQLALYLAEKLHMSKMEYRKTLSFLRKGLIIENNLREKDYSFDYSAVPSAAMNNYRKAFERNDKERFDAYIESVSKGESEMNVETLDIVNFVKRAGVAMDKSEKSDYYEATWKQLVEESTFNTRTIVVRDGSGSMYWGGIGKIMPIYIANALTLLTAARLKGEFANKFITFSSEPEIVDLSKKPELFQKLQYLKTLNDCSTTNIQSVYQLIVDIYKHPSFKPEDAIDQIMIVSDMEFDELRGHTIGDFRKSTFEIFKDDLHDQAIDEPKKSTFEFFKDEFANIGYKMPEVIFWNVDARGVKVPVSQSEEGVKLISGSNKNVIDMVLNTASINPLDFMFKALSRYAFIDELVKNNK